MTQNINDLLKQEANAAVAAGKVKDQTKVTEMSSKVCTEGKHKARLIGYVELGLQPQSEYEGKAKPPATEIRLTFEVFGKANETEYTDEATGRKGVRGALLQVYATEKLNNRATFKKLLDKLREGNPDTTHISQLLGAPFYLQVKHYKNKQGVMKPTLKNGGDFGILPPLVEEQDEDANIIGMKDVSASFPPASYPYRLFLFDAPSIGQWQSIAIEGTRKKTVVNADGTQSEVEESRNFLQDQVRAAVNWEGSAMQAILLAAGEDASGQAIDPNEYERAEDEEHDGEEEAVPVEPKAAPAPKAKPAVAKAAPKAAPAKQADKVDDQLAALGLA